MGQILETAKCAFWMVQKGSKKALVLVQKLTPDALRIACLMRTFPYF
jgi:hypothetical protein